MTGRLYGIGLGPGDPELMTLKAVRCLKAAPVVAYFCKKDGRGHARTIVDEHLPDACEEVRLAYPVTTEIPVHHQAYAACLAPFYAQAAERIAAHLDAGRDVALICEGDPLFYGSFMHLYVRLRTRSPRDDRARRQRHVGLLERRRDADELGRRRAHRASRHPSV